MPTTTAHNDVPGSPLIRLHDVARTYRAGAASFTALANVTLTLSAGECVAVVGHSGSGKTTLINLLTGIDAPSHGTLTIGAQSIPDLSESARAKWRGRSVGIVFQFFQLLPTLTVAENVMLPMDFCAVHRPEERRPRALALLDQLGIVDQADKVPADLSGGQQQRAAIARALANDPPLIVADEPTGNLDSQTSHDVMTFLSSLARQGKTVVTVTHERDYARYFSRTITLRDGRVIGDEAS
jgi:putative ABC transport system ATP-binding protein